MYPTAIDDEWVAISVRDDSEWASAAEVLGCPELAVDERFATPEARLAHHDEWDTVLTEWTRCRTPNEVVDPLASRGVPAERLLTADRMYEVGQLDARGYYQELDHPITGRHRFPGWPFRISPGPQQHHRTPAPTLGQHNAEVFTRLGLSDKEIEALRTRRIIGERVLNA